MRDFAQGDGSNDATALTDDPSTDEAGDPTVLAVDALEAPLPGDETDEDKNAGAGSLLKTGATSFAAMWTGLGLLAIGVFLLVIRRARRNMTVV